MGMRAFQEGRSGAPAQDKDFHALLAEGEPDGTPYKHDGAMKVLTAFADAWMVEQRKASDEALRAEGFPLPRNPDENPVRAASTRGSLSGIDRKAIRAGDVLRYRNVSYIVDNVMKPEDYTAVGLSHVADLMRKQRVIAELVVFKPSTAKHRPSVAKPEKRYAMKVYQNGKLSAPQSKTLGQVPAGRVK